MAYPECGPGWKQLYQPLIDWCIKEDVRVTQIKEKFGGLRFYVGSGGSHELHNAINEAERRSFTICEECGEPGKLYHAGWMKTTCEKHKPEGA